MERVYVTTENRDLIREQYEALGYVAVRDYTDVDGSGYFDFELFIPCEIDKTTMVADGVDSATITILPNPSEVDVEGTIYAVTDGLFEFTVDTPGEYLVDCYSDGYVSRRFIVNAS